MTNANTNLIEAAIAAAFAAEGKSMTNVIFGEDMSVELPRAAIAYLFANGMRVMPYAEDQLVWNQTTAQKLYRAFLRQGGKKKFLAGYQE